MYLFIVKEWRSWTSLSCCLLHCDDCKCHCTGTRVTVQTSLLRYSFHRRSWTSLSCCLLHCDDCKCHCTGTRVTVQTSLLRYSFHWRSWTSLQSTQVMLTNITLNVILSLWYSWRQLYKQTYKETLTLRNVTHWTCVSQQCCPYVSVLRLGVLAYLCTVKKKRICMKDNIPQ